MGTALILVYVALVYMANIFFICGSPFHPAESHAVIAQNLGSWPLKARKRIGSFTGRKQDRTIDPKNMESKVKRCQKYIHPASRGGPPTPQVFWFSTCKDMLQKIVCSILWCFVIVFLQHPRNLYIFGHEVGPKHRFLQCCFNLFFKNNIFYAFFNIKLVQNIGFLQCVQYSNIPNPLKTSVFACFFSLLSVFPLPEASQVRFSVAGTPPKRPKIPSQYPLQIQRPKIVRKITKTPAEEGFRCEIFKGPPPAKADIATAI